MDYEQISIYLKLPVEHLKQFTDKEIELAYLGIGKLDMRFKNKIEPSEYYLSYSGGKDSHLLYWFIKQWLQDTEIKIVGVNTYREHSEIRDRIYKNCDIVLKPMLKMSEINEKYGMPCFTKTQDDYIYRYQNGLRSTVCLERVARTPRANGLISKYCLNKKASKLTLNGELHKVSNKCCDYTKKKSMRIYEKEFSKKAIIGVRGGESVGRASKYKTCLDTKGKFSPLFDFTNDMMLVIEKIYNIEIPKIYKTLNRTGCIGCPYAKDIVTGLKLASKNQIKYALDSFGESYKVKGVYDEILKIYNKK